MACQLASTDGLRTAVFVHIPKTGGQFIEQVVRRLTGAGEVSYPASADKMEARHPLPSALTNRYDFSFSFVRHPLTWYASLWRYNMAWASRKRRSAWKAWGDGWWHPWGILRDCEDHRFDRWVAKVLDNHPAYYTRVCEWYIGPYGWQGLDYVGRTETLTVDLTAILAERLGYDPKHVIAAMREASGANRTKWPQPKWPNTLRDRVLSVESDVIERWYSGRESHRQGRGWEEL